MESARGAALHLKEGLEHAWHLLGRDANSGVADPHVHVIAIVLGADTDLAAVGRVLRRVRQQIQEDLPQLLGVRDDARAMHRMPDQPDVLLQEVGFDQRLQRVDHFVHVHHVRTNREVSRLDLGEREDVVDE